MDKIWLDRDAKMWREQGAHNHAASPTRVKETQLLSDRWLFSTKSMELPIQTTGKDEPIFGNGQIELRTALLYTL